MSLALSSRTQFQTLHSVCNLKTSPNYTKSRSRQSKKFFILFLRNKMGWKNPHTHQYTRDRSQKTSKNFLPCFSHPPPPFRQFFFTPIPIWTIVWPLPPWKVLTSFMNDPNVTEKRQASVWAWCVLGDVNAIVRYDVRTWTFHSSI